MAVSVRIVRLQRELEQLRKRPPWGIKCDPISDEQLDKLEAIIMGPRNSPYEGGAFRVSVNIPQKYPFEPPQLKFITPIYHPNIDRGGRICMDMLKMPPKGSWLPTVTLECLLVSLQTLIMSPNPDDPLEIDIANEYKHERGQFLVSATEHTRKYAC